MKPLLKYLSFIIIAAYSTLYSTYSFSDDNKTTYGYSTSTDESSNQNSLLQEIRDGLYNLGSYLGFNLKSTPESISSTLTNANTQKNIESTTASTVFYILSASTIFPNFFDSVGAYSKNLNSYANQLFTDKTFEPSQYIDAPPYSTSPFSQALLNMISITPDSSCILPDSNNSWDPNCPYPYTESLLYAAALGLDISPSTFTDTSASGGIAGLINSINGKFLYPNASNLSTNQYLLNQIDSSFFLSPLIYDTQSSSDSTSSAQPSNKGQGFNNTSQLAAARNYVRYVTGSILPKSLAETSDVDSKINIISNTSNNFKTRLSAFKDLTSYVLGLRVYAAQMSLPIQNFYEYLASRTKLPSNSSSDTTSSQALNEFIMASYRLYTPQGSEDSTAWQDKINNASPATVEKEMALLLAEINYQLYQMRQQQEKILLTNSLLLINNIRQPSMSEIPSSSSN